jgi:hypothetical protein
MLLCAIPGLLNQNFEGPFHAIDGWKAKLQAAAMLM